MAPALIALGIFVYRPLVETLWLSFFDWNMVRPTRTPVGLDNYAELTTSASFRQAVGNTVRYAAWLIVLILGLPLVVSAGLTYVGARARRLVTGIIFAPMVVSLGISSVLWLWIYNPLNGLLGTLWRDLGLTPISFLSDPATVLGAIAGIVAWKAFGYNTMLMIAGLGTIPREVIEAARVDGAGGGGLWRHIVLPLLGPTIVFVLVATLSMAAEYVFTPIHVLTDGGPVNASTNVVYEIWRQAFRWFRVGYASAIALVVFVLFLALTLLQMRLSERVVSYEER